MADILAVPIIGIPLISTFDFQTLTCRYLDKRCSTRLCISEQLWAFHNTSLKPFTNSIILSLWQTLTNDTTFQLTVSATNWKRNYMVKLLFFSYTIYRITWNWSFRLCDKMLFHHTCITFVDAHDGPKYYVMETIKHETFVVVWKTAKSMQVSCNKSFTLYRKLLVLHSKQITSLILKSRRITLINQVNWLITYDHHSLGLGINQISHFLVTCMNKS